MCGWVLVVVMHSPPNVFVNATMVPVVAQFMRGNLTRRALQHLEVLSILVFPPDLLSRHHLCRRPEVSVLLPAVVRPTGTVGEVPTGEEDGTLA